MPIIVGVLSMVVVFIVFMILGAVMPSMWGDAQSTIFVSTILLSGIIMGSASWVLKTIEQANVKNANRDRDLV